jgi:transcriptional regulator with XRE-family HTH domain
MADGERAERLGEIIRRQRELSALSMRQFADLVGISNPYLSQIDDEDETPAVVEAIRTDPKLTGRQRQAMLEVYRAFTAPAARGRARRSSGA